jgi:hypothetical protein
VTSREWIDEWLLATAAEDQTLRVMQSTARDFVALPHPGHAEARAIDTTAERPQSLVLRRARRR